MDSVAITLVPLQQIRVNSPLIVCTPLCSSVLEVPWVSVAAFQPVDPGLIPVKPNFNGYGNLNQFIMSQSY